MRCTRWRRRYHFIWSYPSVISCDIDFPLFFCTRARWPRYARDSSRIRLILGGLPSWVHCDSYVVLWHRGLLCVMQSLDGQAYRLRSSEVGIFRPLRVHRVYALAHEHSELALCLDPLLHIIPTPHLASLYFLRLRARGRLRCWVFVEDRLTHACRRACVPIGPYIRLEINVHPWRAASVNQGSGTGMAPSSQRARSGEGRAQLRRRHRL